MDRQMDRQKIEQIFEGKTVPYASARILRETVARMASMSDSNFKMCRRALLAYKESIARHCDHHENMWMQNEGCFACLDCGKRRDSIEEKQ